MSSTLDLLRLSPKEAIVSILQSKMTAGFDAAHLTYGPPIVNGVTGTVLFISVNKGTTPLKYWPFTEPFDFHYNRLDLESELGDLNLSVVSELPTTRLALIEKLFASSDIYFDSSEFVDGEVTAIDLNFPIVAISDSYRWVGEVNIGVKQKVEDLADCVTTFELFDAVQYNSADYVQGGSGQERVIQRFIAVNDLNLPAQVDLRDYELTEVTELNSRDDVVNTSVRLTMVNTSRYRGTVVLKYRRLNLAKISGYVNIEVYSRQAVSTITLGLHAANQLNIYMTPEELIEDPLPYITDMQHVDVSVFPRLDSMLYISELTVEWHKGAPV
jgi:hypothetical protein